MPEIFHGSEKDLLQEKCGIVAIYNPSPSQQFDAIFAAASGVQHRGQNGAGIVSKTPDDFIFHTGNGLLNEAIPHDARERFNNPSTYTLLHCRYGTSGSWGPENQQPFLGISPSGEQISVIHNGEFTAVDQMKQRLQTHIPADASDTYIFTKLLTESHAPKIETVMQTLGSVNGAYSLAIGFGDSLFLARDEFGIRPLVLGKMGDGWIAASESMALNKIGVPVLREIKRGEIVHMNENGLHTIREGKNGAGNFCDIEWAYFERPDTDRPTYDSPDDSSHPERWRAIETFRHECGLILAHEAPIKNADIVVGIPDSGIPVGSGYARGLPGHVPYRQIIFRDRYNQQRLFMGDENMQQISAKVLGKLSLSPDRGVWKNAVVVLADDSIIRGSVSAEITRAVFSMGAKEVHWVVGFPPIQHTCHLGVSMRTEEELIANKYNGDPAKIAQEIGATSVQYITNRGFIEARKPFSKVLTPSDLKDIFLANGGCGGCVTGHYPIEKDGTIFQYKKT